MVQAIFLNKGYWALWEEMEGLRKGIKGSGVGVTM